MIRFDNSFARLPAWLFEVVEPTPLRGARLMHVIPELRSQLRLELTDAELARWLNGELFLPGEQRIATRYAGHQFGVWAGQLGDGRALSLGEILIEGGRLEVQTKGSGLTPFSRMGDGKAVIRSSVREYLCSEAMHGLGIPTTRVLALLTGTDEVYRERIERSALVARVFPSNLRFGHFELCYHFKRPAELKALTDYTLRYFYPDLTLEEMLREVIHRTATLVARWMGVGFCHGVMNTDNMSVLGLTIDYGPFGFLEDTILNYICNHSDHSGRYAYNQQPQVAHWNLGRFLVCFLDELPAARLQELLDDYPKIFEAEYQRIAREKLGLMLAEAEDHQLFVQLLQTMATLNLDYTFIFRQLSHYRRGEAQTVSAVWDYYGQRQELKDWLLRYDQRLLRETAPAQERHERMRLANPKYVLKNYIAQLVISDVEQDRSSELERWLNVLKNPFEEHPEFERFAGPTPSEHKHLEVSCSS